MQALVFICFLIILFSREKINIKYLQNPISFYFNYLLLLILLYSVTSYRCLNGFKIVFKLITLTNILNCAHARTIRKKFLKNNSK